jgi:WD40 repeat protein
VALSNDGRYALTGSEDNSARLWDIQTGQELRRFNHGDEVVTVTLSSDGETAFSVAKYDRAVFWSTATGQVLGELPLQQTAVKRGQSFTTARFSPDGKQLLTGNSDRLVQLWDVSSQQLLDSWRLPKRDPWKPTGASVEAVSFSTSSREYFAIASNGLMHRLQRSSD